MKGEKVERVTCVTFSHRQAEKVNLPYRYLVEQMEKVIHSRVQVPVHIRDSTRENHCYGSFYAVWESHDRTVGTYSRRWKYTQFVLPVVLILTMIKMVAIRGQNENMRPCNVVTDFKISHSL